MSWSIHLWSIIFLCQKEMELWCWNGKKSKFNLWPFDPKSTEVLPRSRATYMYHHCMSNERGVIVQKPLFHRRTDKWMDRQPDRQPWWNQYTSTTSLAGQYKLIFNVEKSLKNDPPWRSKFHGGVTFSRPLVQYLMLKFDPCQLLTLKNDPGSHF